MMLLLLVLVLVLLLVLDRARKKVGTEGLVAVSVFNENFPMAVILVLRFTFLFSSNIFTARDLVCACACAFG